MRAAMKATRISLPEEHRRILTEALDAVLADVLDLHAQVKQAHWTIEGPTFVQDHELLDALAGRLLEHGDTIAERIVTIGGVPSGTLRAVSQRSRLPQLELARGPAQKLLGAIAQAHGRYAEGLRVALERCESAGDPVTEDLLTQILGATEKDLWFLESRLA